MKATDVVIVGAPRSGTNMLRDVLTSLDGVATWPCDEINLIWRHGNRDEPSDELGPDMARPEVAEYIHKQFDRIRRRYDAPVVVEKTCATSLRVEFTRRILPDAKYLFITRDGIDAAASAMARWNAPLDLAYTARKARFVPPGDLPFYGSRFLANRLHRRNPSSEDVTSWWGPKPKDYRELMQRHPLEELGVIQWGRCVEASRLGLDGLSSDQLLHVSYEDFVRDPKAGLAAVARFLAVDGDRDDAVSSVSSSSVGKGREQLGSETVARLEALVGSTLHGLGYGN